MKKKIILIMMVLFLAVLACCAEKPHKTGTTDPSEPAAADTAATDTAAPETTEQNGGVIIRRDAEELVTVRIEDGKAELTFELEDYLRSTAFGFADENGSRLLLKCYDTGDGPSFDADPNQFTLAVGPYGELVPVRYSGWQDGTEQNDYRDAAYNFDNLPGFVFKAIDGRLQPDKTYLLTKEGQFTDALIKLNPPAAEKDELTMRYQGMGLKTEDYIYTAKGRGIKWSELLSVTAKGGQIGLFLFEREGDDMLFSIVYLDGPDTLFWDKPAEYDEWCTWRIDMGDEPGSFTPLFLARLDDRLVLALTWGAPEGETMVVLYEENGRLIEKDEYLYSRYWVPN